MTDPQSTAHETSAPREQMTALSGDAQAVTEPEAPVHSPPGLRRDRPRVGAMMRSNETIDIGAAISVRNVTVSYDGKPVLRSVSFDVMQGEMVGIIGPNGAGKSTLMKAILGLEPLNAGSVRFFGAPIDQCRDRVAYVPQVEAVDWDFPVTVKDVVIMGRARRQIGRAHV